MLQNEVWIDNNLEKSERLFVLLHELHERNLMVKEWDYNCAYENSSKIEYHCRMNPNELHMALGNEG
jgi:Zn-dependent peptidase ImmA (M78 family)